MALFARRVVQRELDFLRVKVLRPEQIKSLLNRLNSRDRQVIGTEWEIVITGAFARHSNIQYELPIGARCPDLVVNFQDKHAEPKFIAEIVTVSDLGTHKNNPVDYLYEKIWELALKIGVDFSQFDFQVGHILEGRTPNQRVKLLLPAKKQIDGFLLDQIKPFLRRVKNAPEKRHELPGKPGVDCRLVYDPARVGRPIKSHILHTAPYSLTNNPLYKGLREKAKILRQAEYAGVMGVIAVDGDCYSLQSRYGGGSSHPTSTIVGKFLNKYPAITFVTTSHYECETGLIARNRHRLYHTIYFQRGVLPDIRELLERLLRSALQEIPLPISSPHNALRDVASRTERSRRCALGAYEWTPGRKLSIPVRVFLGLLGGHLTEREFKILFSNTTLPKGGPLIQFFIGALASNALIQGVRIERITDQDDDWITFSTEPQTTPPGALGSGASHLACEVPMSLVVPFFAGLDYSMTLGQANHSTIAAVPEPIRTFVAKMLSEGRLLQSANLLENGKTLHLVFGQCDAPVSLYF